jgi:hypothetical protein
MLFTAGGYAMSNPKIAPPAAWLYTAIVSKYPQVSLLYAYYGVAGVITSSVTGIFPHLGRLIL